MRILILGAGKMGAWFVESLCLEHEVAVYDPDKTKLRYFFNSQKLLTVDEIKTFNPELLINAVSLQHTFKAFDLVLPLISKECILSDIASVKTGIQAYYTQHKCRYVSTHPMFGPTFANIKELANHNAIIIKEGDDEGKAFFRKFYNHFDLNISEYTFDEHDQTTAYSLSVPFISTMVFAACMKKQDAPGTTFKKHYQIAQGLLSEDEYLLSEILFNPYTVAQMEKIKEKLQDMTGFIKRNDKDGLLHFIKELKQNFK